MKSKFVFLLCLILMIGASCSSYRYFFDEESRSRQHELRNRRTGNVFLESCRLLGSVMISAITNSEEFDYEPDDRVFKNMNLCNVSEDTLYVNMLSDAKWDEEHFCDFMDIRIPPQKKCRILVPKFTNYNLYFSNTPEADDDEMIEINTDNFKRIKLFSGLSDQIDVSDENQQIKIK